MWHVHVPDAAAIECARFNGSGTRLLCIEWNSAAQLAVYKLRNNQQQPPDNEKMLLRAKDFTCCLYVGTKDCCFAGTDDELAISTSDDNKLLICSLLAETEHTIVGQSLKILQGHTNFLNCVRYSNEQSTIASCDSDGVIKLWAPGSYQQST